ncbi:MAG: DUF2946 family protein [Myxococcales bacterium]|nr:DUF2946 family protein [Myxococcales bacterium]MCB9642113.1 DUF2946 family protein [Myxococcales bacterium]
MSEKKAPSNPSPSSDLPPFDPQGTESIESIPSRFLLGGLITLKDDGRWFFRGEWIEHAGVCHFLQKQLRRTAEGEYWVVNGPQRVMVQVEDAPYIVREVREAERGEVWIRLSDGSQEKLRPETLHSHGEDRLYATVKWGEAGAQEGEGHIARFSREAVAQLATWLVEDEAGRLGLSIQERFFPIAL